MAQEDLLLGGLDPQVRHAQYLGEQQRTELVGQQQPAAAAVAVDEPRDKYVGVCCAGEVDVRRA